MPISRALCRCATLLAMTVIGCSKSDPVEEAPKVPVPDLKEAVNLVGGTDDDNRRADVVFVHGLDGNYLTTWQADDTPGSLWPKWLSEDNPGVAIWSVSYESKSSDWYGGSMPIEDRAKNLLAELKTRDIGKRPLLFVTHSLGGLVVKKILNVGFTMGDTQWEEIAGNTQGVVFLGTPNAGSSTGEYLKLIGSLYRPTVQVEQLQKNSPMLRDLNVWYRNNAEKQEIKTLVFFENKPMPIVGLIVDQGSADPGITGVTPVAIDATHITICKPRSKRDLIYRSVNDFLQETVLYTGKPIEISIEDFAKDFSQVRYDPAKLATFKKDYGGKRVTWDVVVYTVNPDEDLPNYMIGKDAATSIDDRIMASFATSDFNASIPANTRIKLEGTVRSLAPNGARLHQCKVIQRLP